MKINPKKIIKKIKALPKKVAKHSFAAFFVFFLLDFVFGVVVFYKYVFLIEKTKPEILKTPLRFDSSNYQEVLNYWQKREENLEKINYKQYINPFQETRISFQASTENDTGEIKTLNNEEIIIPTSTEQSATVSEGFSINNQEETSTQEKSKFSAEIISKLLFASNIFDFYRIKNEIFPTIPERAIMWEARGLGEKDDYYGGVYQNMLLLQSLKKDLTK